jgi:hypothetical protein
MVALSTVTVMKLDEDLGLYTFYASAICSYNPDAGVATICVPSIDVSSSRSIYSSLTSRHHFD